MNHVLIRASKGRSMSLLRSKHDRKPKRRVPEYCTLGCVAYERGHQITWCRLICTPIGNMGACGRLAPHSMIGRTQAAIAAYKAAKEEE